MVGYATSKIKAGAILDTLTHAITSVKNDKLVYILREIEAEVWVVTQVEMLAEVKVLTLARL